ncbi:large ribosomal subunit protein bL34m [Gouania willdenowi]|uniref:Large ribosomal subunit protein bL34m n=1 Tax=Gouania willdenowi TaxID=441366 RepID=A0A8C5EL60_GOUWI|nr:39S ribosomal protein L34, mitochondrial [Gouania willdenowi]
MNNILTSVVRLRGFNHLSRIPAAVVNPSAAHLSSFSGWMGLRADASRLCAGAEGGGVFQQLPWCYNQVRTKKRGMEYQPKNIKRKRTHGWIKRLSSQGGIEVILRRMLKGRKSLSH